MKVAILIPTLNRPSFIQRTVTYYDSLKSPHPIYIGDASNAEISKNTLAFLKEIKNVEVKYFHWDGLSFGKTLLKLAEEASAECEYCVFQGDDDYFIPTSLTKCAAFLSENPDYRTAQGRAGLVVMDSPEPVGNIKWIDEYWGKNSLEESGKIERLLSFNKNCFVIQFSVHRVSEFITDSYGPSTIIDKDLYEYTHCFTIAINGKSKFIDCLYMVRSRHPDLLLSSSGGGFFESIAPKNWSLDYDKMIDSLSRILSDDKNMSFPEAKKIVSDMMKERLENGFLKASARIKDKMISFYEKLKNIIPDYLINKLKLMKNRLLNKEISLLMTKHSRFHSDFLPVENSLTGKEIRLETILLRR